MTHIYKAAFKRWNYLHEGYEDFTMYTSAKDSYAARATFIKLAPNDMSLLKVERLEFYDEQETPLNTLFNVTPKIFGRSKNNP